MINRWYGIELCSPLGRHDGTVQGVRYFAAAPNTGVFVTESKLTKIFDNSQQQQLLAGNSGGGSCGSSRSGGSDSDQQLLLSQEEQLQQQQQREQQQQKQQPTVVRRKSISMKFRATQSQQQQQQVCVDSLYVARPRDWLDYIFLNFLISIIITATVNNNSYYCYCE